MKKIFILLVSLSSIFTTSFAQSIENAIIKQINQLRLQKGGPDSGLSPFVRNSALDSAAMYHARWVVASGLRSHTETREAGSIKPLPGFWDRSAKYGATSIAENLIQYCQYVKSGETVDTFKTATVAFTSWKNSPGHLANMLITMPKQVQARIGLAIVPYSDGNYFCIVMVVGANIDTNGQLIK
jgi:uncharacterized protein YkwD